YSHATPATTGESEGGYSANANYKVEYGVTEGGSTPDDIMPDEDEVSVDSNAPAGETVEMSPEAPPAAQTLPESAPAQSETAPAAEVTSVESAIAEIAMVAPVAEVAPAAEVGGIEPRLAAEPLPEEPRDEDTVLVADSA